jgi:hypothetical protein
VLTVSKEVVASAWCGPHAFARRLELRRLGAPLVVDLVVCSRSRNSSFIRPQASTSGLTRSRSPLSRSDAPAAAIRAARTLFCFSLEDEASGRMIDAERLVASLTISPVRSLG